MIDEFLAAMEVVVPLRIQSVEVVDPVVSLIGKGWSFSLACPWRLSRANRVLATSDDPDAGDPIWDLIGHEIVRVHAAANGVDPVFGISGGVALEIAADTDLDPWVFQLPGRTFVGTGSRGRST